jgi:hypothetical protein
MFQEVGDGGGGDGMMVKVGAGGHHQETKPQMVHKERLHEVCDGGRGDVPVGR